MRRLEHSANKEHQQLQVQIIIKKWKTLEQNQKPRLERESLEENHSQMDL
jgi:hypothetical protein